MLVCIAIFGGITCWITHRQLKFTQEMMGFESPEYSTGLYDAEARPATPVGASWRRRRAQRRAQRLAGREQRETGAVDVILRKIAQSGMESLTGPENPDGPDSIVSARLQDWEAGGPAGPARFAAAVMAVRSAKCCR